MKTLVTQPHPELKKIVWSETALKKLSDLSDVDWVEEGYPYTGKPLEKIIKPYDVVLSGWRSPKVGKAALERAKNLKFIGHAAGTVVPFIEPEAFDKGIKVVNANSTLGASTAEGAFALILTAAWNFVNYYNNARKGIWYDNDRETVLGLQDQKVGLIGLGVVSRKLIKLIKPFEPEIYLYSEHCTDEEATELGIIKVSLEHLLKKCKVISLHATLNSRTEGMIGKKELDMIQDEALLVNTARAAIIQNDPLIETLKSGRIYAAIDVFLEEPLPKDHILLNLPNVISTPHMLGASSFWKRRLGLTVIDDLVKWMNGQPLENEITREEFLRQSPK